MNNKIIYFLLFTFLATPIFSQIIYVDQAAKGQNKGTNWEDAFQLLQFALSTAQYGDTIWVAAGTYTPNQADQDDSFYLPSGVTLLGGFAGMESKFDERNITINKTILSGERGDTSIIEDNHFNVVSMTNVDSNTVIDGFTVTKGYANNQAAHFRDHTLRGGGIFLESTNDTINVNPKIKNCIFIENTGYRGGAIYIGGVDTNNSANFKLSPLIENCLFYRNVAIWEGGGINKVGGGVTFIVRGCQFIENKVTKRYGAGVNFLNPFGENVIEDCVFERDTAFRGEGGGLSYETTEQNSILKLINTNFKDNYAGTSGPVLRMFGNGLFGKRGTHTAIIKNCDFDNNFSYLGSGGVFTISNYWNKYIINIESCNFTNNYARNGGGSIYSQTNFDSISLTINKCIFQNNSGVTGFDGNIFLRPNAPQKINYHSLQISNSLFTGNAGAVSVFASGGNADTKINNCTFYNNGFSPIVKNWLSDFEKTNRYNTMEFTNSIIYEQEVPTIEGLFFNNSLDSAHLTDYTLKNCWISTLPSEDYIVDGEYLIFDKYPLFRDAENGDFSLKYCSPAINAGDNQFSLNIEEDIFDNPRVINEIVDMGAIESDLTQEETLIDTLISSGETIQMGAFTFDEPGTYFVHLENENGCDSLIRLTLDFSTATSNLFGDWQVNLFPNPTSTNTSQLNMVVTNQQEVVIRIFDTMGRLINNQNVKLRETTNYISLDLKNIKGNYWVQVVNSKGDFFYLKGSRF